MRDENLKLLCRAVLMFTVLLMTNAVMGTASEAASKKGFGQIERVDLITDVLPEGEKVVAIAIEYKKEINSESLSTSTYVVNGTHGENTAIRNITKGLC